jgi:uncharacterized protein
VQAAIGCAAFVALLAACGGNGDPLGETAEGSIRGTVADAVGVGVPNAAMSLTGNGQASRATSTGADGAYAFADLPAGTYTVAVTPPTGFTVGAAGTASVTVASGAEASASTFVLDRIEVTNACTVARPDFGGPATDADRALFAYDANAPLNLQQTVESATGGVQFSGISYTSPDGGSVPGILVEPIGRSGLRPGMVILHPSGVPARGMGPYATMLAEHGAVVIAIDAPYFRRGGSSMPLFTPQDRTEQIQLMKDLQRAVDVLRAHPAVDPARIAFEGYSYGGILGAQFVGIERRLKAAVLAAAMGGQVTGATTAANLAFLANNLTCAARNTWFQAMVPVEPIRFIPNASPTALLFQIGRFDTAVLPLDAQALADAASSPKEILYYDTGHSLNQQALFDRHDWLHAQIGIDARQ